MQDTLKSPANVRPKGVTLGVTSAGRHGTLTALASDPHQAQESPYFSGASSAPSSVAAIGATPTRMSRSYQTRKDTLLEHSRTLSDAALHKHYGAEDQSWRAMLRREKDGLCVVDDEFRDFRRYLAHIGPQPKKGYTVDRIDNDNRTYGPGLVRWASRKTQNNNKGDTSIFTDPRTGKKYSTSDLARKHGLSGSVIRKRRSRKWTDAEQIAGKRLPGNSTPLRKVAATTLLSLWEELMAAAYPDHCTWLTPTGKKQLGQFEEFCRDAGFSPDNVLCRAVTDWGGFGQRAEAEYGLPENSAPCIPQTWFLSKHAASAVTHWIQPVVGAAYDSEACKSIDCIIYKGRVDFGEADDPEEFESGASKDDRAEEL